MYSICYVRGHIHVYDYQGNFLFSADTEREAREEIKIYRISKITQTNGGIMTTTEKKGV